MTIVNNTVNDCAATVLPDAPIDPATGLPVPTIAVATEGGVSVIKDDGTVVDSSSTVSYFFVDFSRDNDLLYRRGSQGRVYGVSQEDYKSAGFVDTNQRNYSTSSTPALLGDAQTGSVFGENVLLASSFSGLSSIYEDQSDGTNSMVAYTTSTYNTGFQNGDIKGTFLSDTDDTDLVGSGELVTNGTFDTDLTGWTAGDGASALSHQTDKMRVTNSDDSSAFAFQDISTTNGATYVLQAEVVTVSGGSNARILVGDVDTGGTLTVGSHAITFEASAGTTTLKLSNGDANDSTDYVEWDNISVKLADEDRSVNNNGLIVNGTITRTFVDEV